MKSRDSRNREDASDQEKETRTNIYVSREKKGQNETMRHAKYVEEGKRQK